MRSLRSGKLNVLRSAIKKPTTKVDWMNKCIIDINVMDNNTLNIYHKALFKVICNFIYASINNNEFKGGYYNDDEFCIVDYYYQNVISANTFSQKNQHTLLILEKSERNITGLNYDAAGTDSFVLFDRNSDYPNCGEAYIALLLYYLFTNGAVTDNDNFPEILGNLIDFVKTIDLDDYENLLKDKKSTLNNLISQIMNKLYEYIFYEGFQLNYPELHLQHMDFENIFDFNSSMLGKASINQGNKVFTNSPSGESLGKPMAFLSDERSIVLDAFGKMYKKNVKDYGKEFYLDENRVYTEEEIELMKTNNVDHFVPNEKVLNMARMIKLHFDNSINNLNRGINELVTNLNCLWVGETGTGKSTSSRILAKLLGIPYVFITMGPETQIDDLFSEVLPNTNELSEAAFKELVSQLPSIEMCRSNPIHAYELLTGITNLKCDVELAINERNKKVDELCSRTNKFISAESQFLKAYKNGWLIEIQEANLLKNQGVLAQLNGALDDNRTAVTKQGIFNRNNSCVIIMTMNNNYNGTRRLNQAVESRMTFKEVFELPNEDEYAEQISLITGYKDLVVIKKMIQVSKQINKVLNDLGEEEKCFNRELQTWALNCKVGMKPYDGALNTIINSATYDPEVKASVLSALETAFF